MTAIVMDGKALSVASVVEIDAVIERFPVLGL